MRTSLPRRLTVSACAAAAVAASVFGASAQASADSAEPELYRAALRPVPHDPAADAGSNVAGRAKLSLEGNMLKVRLKARGLSPLLPHAAHIHGEEAAGELAMCPGADRRDDLVDDGLIETVEGLGDYGGILVSFTTSGDTTAASGLALDRMPVAKENGLLKYKRTLEVPSRIADRLDELHVVIHGEDLDGDGAYGGRTTALGAPLEAELPVACGEIVQKR